MLNYVSTNNAPKAIGPYSQGVIVGNILFTSGQISIDPETNELVNGDILVQAERVMKNLESIVNEAGSSLDNTIKTTCYLANMDDFSLFNEVYSKYFINKPARSCVAVKTLPKNVLCEVEAIVEVN